MTEAGVCGAFVEGVSLSEQGRFGEAIEYFQRAVLELPESADAWVELGVCYTSVRRTADAEACFRRALEIRPGLIGATLGLAESLRESDSKACEGILRDLLPSEDPIVLGMFGNFLAVQGRYNEAEQMFREALAKSPDDLYSLEGYAQLLDTLDRTTEAERYFRQALNASGQQPKIRFHLGRFLSQFPTRLDESNGAPANCSHTRGTRRIATHI